MEIKEFEPEVTGIEVSRSRGRCREFFGSGSASLGDDHESRSDGGHEAAVRSIVNGASTITGVTEESESRAKVPVNCAELHSDHIAQLAGVETKVRIVPFRGEYYRLPANGQAWFPR